LRQNSAIFSFGRFRFFLGFIAHCPRSLWFKEERITSIIRGLGMEVKANGGEDGGREKTVMGDA
jgi:hypothetical protein